MSKHISKVISKVVAQHNAALQKARGAQSESQIQQAVIRWWTFAHNGLGVQNENRLFAVPNGARRDPNSGHRLKCEGMRAGVADLFLLVPRGDCHALVIEMKKPGGRIQPNQLAFLKDISRDGYASAVCWSFDDAVKVITTYLKLRAPLSVGMGQ